MTTFGYDRILVPTDMSEFATLALRYAVMFNERLGSAVTLLYADEFYLPIDLLDVPMGYYLDNAPATKVKLHEKLREYGAAHAPCGVDTLVVQDAPARAIATPATDIGANLIIMGTHGRRGWRRALLGSVTEAVLHDVEVTLLTITPSLMENGRKIDIRRILCPVNFTRIAREALQQACTLAVAFGAELHIVYVAEGFDEKRTPQLEAAFSQWVEPQIRERCTYKALVTHHGDPAERVLEIAAEIEADLMVIGAQHRHFYEATIIGTTTERMTRFSRCPVLTVMRGAVVEEDLADKKLVEVG
jgi:nucleotide-binding universal stress UspA family protein